MWVEHPQGWPNFTGSNKKKREGDITQGVQDMNLVFELDLTQENMIEFVSYSHCAF